MSWELVSGLETHVELSTNTKIFCGCTTKFGGEPNTNCCPICIGLPGTLPKLNRQVVHYAIMAGLATHCTINNVSKMDRKTTSTPTCPRPTRSASTTSPCASTATFSWTTAGKSASPGFTLRKTPASWFTNTGTPLWTTTEGACP